MDVIKPIYVLYYKDPTMKIVNVNENSKRSDIFYFTHVNVN